MKSEAFKGQFMTIEAPIGFVEWTENSCGLEESNLLSG